MTERILIAGAGGQGVLFLGKLLARLACDHGKHVTYMPAYGAEVRGGTSHCRLVIASEEIANPLPERLDTLVAMNKAASDSFLPALAADGIALVNSSLCGEIANPQCLAVPATETADRLGNVAAANLVMLGAYTAAKRLFEPDAVEKGISAASAKLGAKTAELNLAAFREGLRITCGRNTQ